MSRKRHKKLNRYQKDVEEKMLKTAHKYTQRQGSKSYSQRDNPHTILLTPENDSISFGLMADAHLCSKYCNENGVKEYFARMRDKGVNKIFIAGDLMDGLFVYRDQLNDLKVIGVDEQVDYASNFIEKALPENIKLYGINGNHENRTWEKVGVDMSRLLERNQPKYKYLTNGKGGNVYATVVLRPNITLDLLHTNRYVGERGAPEYLLMKVIDGYLTYNQPDMIGVGHTHKHTSSDYREMKSWLLGAFTYPNHFIARSREGQLQGGYFIKLCLEKDKIREIEESFIRVKS